MKTINELYKDDKPREKLIARGTQALKNEELMAVLLGSGIQGKDVRKLAREIVGVMDKGLEGLTLEILCAIHGMGQAKASQILAAIELSRRYIAPRSHRRITDARYVHEELHAYASRAQEHFILLTLDGASHIINTHVVFIGTLNQSLVHPREVFSLAISDRAAGIIIAHNHPSGTLEASRPDLAITQRLQEVARLVGIDLLDHVILSKEGYFSFSDEGLL